MSESNAARQHLCLAALAEERRRHPRHVGRALDQTVRAGTADGRPARHTDSAGMPLHRASSISGAQPGSFVLRFYLSLLSLSSLVSLPSHGNRPIVPSHGNRPIAPSISPRDASRWSWDNPPVSLGRSSDLLGSSISILRKLRAKPRQLQSASMRWARAPRL